MTQQIYTNDLRCYSQLTREARISAYTTKPASNFNSAELADLFNRGFEDYFIPLEFSKEQFSAFIKRDGINLSLSRVLLYQKETCGIGLIAKRGGVSRLGGMGIAKERRSKGAGTWLVKQLMDEARKRGEQQMGLEVITQNDPAVHLYEKYGFKKIRQLIGFIAKEPIGKADDGFESCNMEIVINKAKRHSLPDLPWQVDAISLRQYTGSTFGYCLGDNYISVTDPKSNHVVVRSLVSDNYTDGGGENLLKALFAKFPGKIWHVPAIFPEELASTFQKSGMVKEELSQWQMVADL